MKNQDIYIFYHISVYTDIIYTVFDNGSGNTPILSLPVSNLVFSTFPSEMNPLLYVVLTSKS